MHLGAQNAIVSTDSAATKPSFPRVTLAVSTCVWLLVVCVGVTQLWRYSNAPGDVQEPPSIWPTQSGIARSSERATLLVFVHPYCPCTRATLGELERLLTDADGGQRVEAFAVFMKPESSTSEWEQSDLWRKAVAIPGVTAIPDEGMVECERFRAQTSGLTLLYDRHGALRFHGGITSSRGHEGDNVGRNTILSLLLDRTVPIDHAPVFGCCLQSTRSTKPNWTEGKPWND